MRRRFMSNYMIGIDNYLTIVALEDGLTSQFSTNGCEYCVDGDGNWKILSANTNTETINTGQTLSFRGNLIPSINRGIGIFTISKSCNLEGNCMSMLFGDEAVNNNSLEGKDYAFYRLFYNCSTIKSVSSGFLPATTLSADCYYYMFWNCTNLTHAPELPATTLATYCYRYMFQGCTSLTHAPELPATTLADSCYCSMFSNTNALPDCSNIDFSSASIVSSGGLRGLFASTKVTDSDLERILPKNSNGKYCLPATTVYPNCYSRMFENCTSLTQAPELPAMRLSQSCYSYMFEGCSSLITAPALPAMTLAHACYNSMFSGCTNLTHAPELPATTLATYCYSYMFYGCTNLTQAPELPATTLAGSCYYFMFYNCASLTTAPSILPATTLAESCYSAMFSGCTNLTTAPELPATTLVVNCYQYMFSSCPKLNYIKALFATTPSTSYTFDWVRGVSSVGTFVRNPNATWNVKGTNGIPSGWTVQTA